jgi:Translationally controlled tumour protein
MYPRYTCCYLFYFIETQIGSATDFKGWIKDYMNSLRTAMKEKGKGKEKIQEFMGQATGIAKYLLQNFSNLQFYLGPGYNPETMVFAMYPEGATVPNFYYIMAGFDAEKF